MSEAFTAGSTTTYRDYILADGGLVALRLATGSNVTLRYVVTDHLGSAAVITDSSGAVLQRLSYDAWGARRNPDGTVPSSPIIGIITRGFTGQEMIDDVALINFNARLYDPQLGRFITADPAIPNDYLDQLLDRYSYVGNNPLSLTDPTGLCFITCDSALRTILAIIVAVALPELLPEIETPLLVGEAATDIGASVPGLELANIGLAGGLAGLISTGNAKGALLGAAEAVAFFEVGNVLQADKLLGTGQTAATFVAHGAVGGLFTVAGGGAFGSGFLAAGVGSLGDNAHLDNSNIAVGTAEHAVLGGLGSLLGGGKFENGAITGAFGYLFNWVTHHYAYQPNICNYSDPACTAQSAWSGLEHNAYPGQDPNTLAVSGQTYYVFGSSDAPIRITVDASDFAIVNRTLPGHIFCCGSVTLQLIFTQTGIDLSVIGSGTNPSQFNKWLNLGAALTFPELTAPAISSFMDQSYYERIGAWPSSPTMAAPPLFGGP
ncbi:MAG: RHS repeat domain-containing protein [Caulobacteraceae bacterium]